MNNYELFIIFIANKWKSHFLKKSINCLRTLKFINLPISNFNRVLTCNCNTCTLLFKFKALIAFYKWTQKGHTVYANIKKINDNDK